MELHSLGPKTHLHMSANVAPCLLMCKQAIVVNAIIIVVMLAISVL